MAELIITHRQRDYLLKMPYQVIINGRLAGVMRTPQARLFISWMEQQRVVLGPPDHIKQLRQADIEDIIDDAFEEAAPMYPVPVLYDAIELEQFLAPLLASNTNKKD